MTDVTGFGLLGHLVEMAEGSDVSAEINFANIPLITDDLFFYIEQKAFPGALTVTGTVMEKKLRDITPYQKAVLADPQTSGGLLIAAAENAVEEIVGVFKRIWLR